MIDFISLSYDIIHEEVLDVLRKKHQKVQIFAWTVNNEKFKAIDWSTVAFLSTNSAYNIRSSQIISKFNEV